MISGGQRPRLIFNSLIDFMDHPLDFNWRLVPVFSCDCGLCCTQPVMSFSQQHFPFFNSTTAIGIGTKRLFKSVDKPTYAVFRFANNLKVNRRSRSAKRRPRIIFQSIQRHINDFWWSFFSSFDDVGTTPDCISAHYIVYIDAVEAKNYIGFTESIFVTG